METPVNRHESWHNHNITLILGDCRAWIAAIEPSRYQLIITDPPYGIDHPVDYKTRGRGEIAECSDYPVIEGDDEPFDPAQILSLGKPTVLWGANYYADKLPISSGWLVWDKRRPPTIDQATCELAWTNFIKGVRIFHYLWNGAMRHGKEELFHPMQKPVALSTWILYHRWTPDGTVFDPYMGAGGTGVACAHAGRGYIGIEKNETYYNIAKERISKALQQPKLF